MVVTTPLGDGGSCEIKQTLKNNTTGGEKRKSDAPRKKRMVPEERERKDRQGAIRRSGARFL